MSQKLLFNDIDEILSTTCESKNNFSKRMKKVQWNKTAEFDHVPDIELHQGQLLAKAVDPSFRREPWTAMLNDYPQYEERKNVSHQKRIYANKPDLARKKLKLILVLVKEIEEERGKVISLSVEDHSDKISLQINFAGMENFMNLIEPGTGLILENVFIRGNSNFPHILASKNNLQRIYFLGHAEGPSYTEIPKNLENFKHKISADKLLEYADKT